MPALLDAMDAWVHGTRLEQRAAVAGICEPDLLHEPAHAARVLTILDTITASMVAALDRRSENYRVLRQTLGYAWSVAVVAWPEKGKVMMERWLTSQDPDIRWVMRQNLHKNRLLKMDPAWVKRWQQ